MIKDLILDSCVSNPYRPPFKSPIKEPYSNSVDPFIRSHFGSFARMVFRRYERPHLLLCLSADINAAGAIGSCRDCMAFFMGLVE